MNPWLIGWWWRRIGGPDRLVLLASLAVRSAGVAMLGYGLILVGPHLPNLGWSVLFALVLAGESGVVLWWSLRARVPLRATLALDLPVGVAALMAGAYLAAPATPVGWTDVAFPYTVLLAFTFGLACRTLAGAVLSGLVWAGAQLAAVLLIEHQPLLASLSVVPSYVVNPTVGWLSALLLRRGARESDRAWELSVRHAEQVAVERERARHAWALHDRILQTLETLARGDLVGDCGLRGRVARDAAWLRRFVETGEVSGVEDLATGLAAAVQAVADDVVDIEFNDADVRERPLPLTPGSGLEALIEATREALAGVAAGADKVFVRVTLERGGVLVTMLASGASAGLDMARVDLARRRLAQANGELTAEPVPYVELWVPL